MPRKPARTTSPRRSRWSDEQIKEWRRRDEEIDARSTTYLEDAERVREFMRHAASGQVSTRILSYSERNQMLLFEQAAALGFTLTDVDTAKGWRSRRRRVKPEWYGQGLRLVAPKKRKKDADPTATAPEDDHDDERDDEPDEDQADEPTAEADGSEGKPAKTRFRTVAVFDIAQTEALPAEETKEDCELCGAQAGQPCTGHCACSACVDHIDADDAPDVIWNNLLQQITDAGYRYDWPALDADLHGAAWVRVDHDATTVYAAFGATADRPEAIGDLAAALAEIIVRADRARAARREQRKALRALPAA